MAVRPIDGEALLKELTCDFTGTPFHGNKKVTIGEVRRIIESIPTLTPPPITGDTSDGYHTFNELYHHRAILFSVVCNEQPDIAWKSKRHHDGTMYNGMFIVGINTPEGQATYHYDIDPYWELFHVKELEYAPEWDGHTPDEAIRRIGTLTPQNEWISVDERLPDEELNQIKRLFPGENEVEVLVMIEGAYIATTLYWDGEKFYDETSTYEVTHWMPLPAPPEKEDSHE